MPPPTTTDEFLELVRKSGVVEEKKLSAYLDKVRAAQTLPNAPGTLAGVLMRDGLLTRFQAEQFLQGRWKRFSLGKYKVLEKLGSGGMGNVFLCEHKLMRRRVAVKVLPESRAEDQESLERFYREARAVAALDHPNIVRAYDIDQDDKLHFLVMEHVDGASLQEMVSKTGPMDVLRACHYIRQAAQGLQHAHDTAGIVHRDIKPGNILVDRNGIVKILDMGLARFFHDEEDVLTKKYEDNVLGTADYLAPEQALDSHSVDIRADIYSLGATFYFCLTGRTLFADGTVAQKLIWHQTRQPKPIRQLRPEVPEGVAAIVEKMMAKDANQRPQTPQEAAEALAPWTQTPIPPPSEEEMPRLCLAALGNVPSDPNQTMGPKTPPSTTDFSVSSRKVWQVPQRTTTAPLTAAPPTANPAPPTTNDLRKTNPPSGSLNLELALPSVPRNGEHKSGTATAPQVRAVNGSVPAAAPQRRIVTAEPEQEEPWRDFLEPAEAVAEVNGEVTHAERRNPVTKTQRAVGLPPPGRGGVIVLAALSVLGLILIACILVWTLGGGETKATVLARSEPAVFHVNPQGGENTVPSIAEALKRLRGKSNSGARIIVQDDIEENDLFLDVPRVRIEAEEGKTIHWRPSADPRPTKLFMVSKAADVHIKGFTLDGDNRVDILVNLFHRCPGVRLEDLRLQGFKKFGIWITNCEGGEAPERRIQFNRLEFATTDKPQAALFFSIEPGMRDAIPKNRYLTFHDCTFAGSGTAVKTPDPSTLENIDWPPNVEPQKGGRE
ncbi:MAG: serine/threonine protein kinase [Gemmataceae bacterium]